jgi:hypothetical protein
MSLLYKVGQKLLSRKQLNVNDDFIPYNCEGLIVGIIEKSVGNRLVVSYEVRWSVKKIKSIRC